MSKSFQIPCVARCSKLFTQTRALSTEASPKTPSNPLILQTKPKSNRPEDQFKAPHTTLQIGTVSRTNTMPKTVQITQQVQIFDKFLQKHYTRPQRVKAHDPIGHLREGDVVRFGRFSPEERDAKVAKKNAILAKEVERLEGLGDKGRALRKFLRTQETIRKLKGEKVRGVQFVVRSVVTPFGVDVAERMNLDAQPPARMGGQDSLAKGLGGNVSRQSGSAAVAG